MRHPSGSATCLILGLTSVLFWWFPLVGLPAVAGAILAARYAVNRTPEGQFNSPALIARVLAGFGFLFGMVAVLWWLALIGLAGAAHHAPAGPLLPPAPELLW
jgi:hypothetical protein